MFADLVGIPRRKEAKTGEQYQNLKMGIIPNEIAEKHLPREIYDRYKEQIKPPVRCQMLFGEYINKEKGVVTDEFSIRYNKQKYEFMLSAPFYVSDKCCKVMKKAPLHAYSRSTGRKPITAQMADESDLRKANWVKYGCNGFQMKSPISNPLSFWTEQDILQYIKYENIAICSVYGEVVEDYEAEGLMNGQVTFEDFDGDKIYKTTGCKRTGCMLCGFGCHLGNDNRFLQLKESHPKMYNLLDIVKNNGVTFREAIEWTNEHGNLNIRL